MYKTQSTCNILMVKIVTIVLMCNYVLSTPMLYKRNPDDKYERDLVPVSSTVIPLTALEVSYGYGGKPSEEYKEAYLKRLRKKVQHDNNEDAIFDDADTLITIKRKHNGATDKAKVKGIVTAAKHTSSESKN